MQSQKTKARLKVAHVIGALTYGGVESIALDLIRRLPEEAIRSSVYYIGVSLTERRRDFEDAAEAFVHCPYNPPRRLDFIRRLRAAFRRDGVDVVLAYSFGNHAWVSMAGRLAGARRCYVSVQGSPTRDGVTRRKSSVLSHLARPFCTGEIAASNRVREELVRGLRMPSRRVHVVENACDVGGIAARAAGTRRRRAADAPPEILMVARMDDAKDHRTLILACAALVRSGLPVRLRFAGDGPDRPKHEALCRDEGVADAVEFMGDRTDVPELMAASDVVVLATHTEGFGIVLAEAMSARTPVVASDIPVCREVLAGGACGLLVPPRDPAAMAAAIRRLLGDEALRDRLTREGFARASEFYDVSRLVGKYAALLTGGRRAADESGALSL